MCFRFILVGVFIGVLRAEESKCCVSKRFFAQVKSLTAIGSKDGSSFTVTENKFELDYDHDTKMETRVGTYFTDDGQRTSLYSYTLINDFRKLKSYYMFNNTGLCSVENISLDEQTPICVPSNLTLKNSYVVGSGPEAVHVNSWEGVDGNLTRSIQTSAYDCTPVSATHYGRSPKGDNISGTTLYGNYTQYRVRNPDVFNIPAACIEAEKTIFG